jgi:hypothetical protein
VNNLEAQLRQATFDVVKVGAKFAVVGGLAVSARAEPRMTRDADLAIAVRDDREAEQIIHAMQERGYSVLAAVEQDAAGRLATVRLVKDASAITDLLFASCGIETEIVERSTRVSVVLGLVLPGRFDSDEVACSQ